MMEELLTTKNPKKLHAWFCDNDDFFQQVFFVFDLVLPEVSSCFLIWLAKLKAPHHVIWLLFCASNNFVL